MRFPFYNDTGRVVSIHIATKSHGTVCDMSDIQPLELRWFEIPDGTIPFIKMWDYSKYGRGLSILVSPSTEDTFK